MPSDAKILIVDDHEDTVYALESALAPLGYRLTRATSGDAALKEVLRGQVGLLLLDVRMPGVSGLDVVRYMRRLEQTQHIPVVLLTGFGPDAELTATAFRLGVADLVMKPIDPWSLRTKVRYLYDAHERSHALEREVRELRARLRDHTPPGPALPHPDSRVPVQRDRADNRAQEVTSNRAQEVTNNRAQEVTSNRAQEVTSNRAREAAKSRAQEGTKSRAQEGAKDRT